jgi:hypothetical protein
MLAALTSPVWYSQIAAGESSKRELAKAPEEGIGAELPNRSWQAVHAAKRIHLCDHPKRVFLGYHSLDSNDAIFGV